LTGGARVPIINAEPISLGFESSFFTVGFFGQLTANKGIEDFLEAARTGLQTNSKLKFVVIGDNADDPAFVNELKTRFVDIAEQVSFLGFVSNVERYYHSVDAVVVASRHPDPAPNVNLEGMAAGVPVIATDIGGSPELVADGETGFIVPPRSPSAIVEKTLQLASDDELASRMGEAGKRRCRERFDAGKNARKVESLIVGETE